MGGILGGGGDSSGGGGGILSDLLGGLPDPLGIGKMLGITKDKDKIPDSPMMGQAPSPLPAGVQYAQQQHPSGVSPDPGTMGISPMGPVGMGVGGRRQ